MIPGSGGTQRLARLIGLGRAKDVGHAPAADRRGRGARLGLVSEIVPAGELDAAVDRVIAELAELSPLALAWPSASSTTSTTGRSRSASSSKGSPTACCARPRLPRGRRGVRRERRRVRGPLRPVDFGLVRSSYLRHPTKEANAVHVLIYDDEQAGTTMTEDERSAVYGRVRGVHQSIRTAATTSPGTRSSRPRPRRPSGSATARRS